MIVEYHRPDTLESALSLLERVEPETVPMGGGTKLNKPSEHKVAVVDLQTLANQEALGLNRIEVKGKKLVIGGAVTLQSLLSYPGLHEAVGRALKIETSINLREVSTTAGTLVSAAGRSSFAAVMLALDAQLTLTRLNKGMWQISLGDFYALRTDSFKHHLILSVEIPLSPILTFESIAKTPKAVPLISTAVAKWPSGRWRGIVAGFGQAPILAFDGPDPDGHDTAASQAVENAVDHWASAEYRSEMAGVLVRRCRKNILEEINA